MRGITIFGDDLAQLTGLAAALRTRFSAITLVHTERPLDRAIDAVDSPTGRSVLCLCSRPIFCDDPRLADVALVLPSGPEFDAMRAAGGRCFAPGDIGGLTRFLTGPYQDVGKLGGPAQGSRDSAHGPRSRLSRQRLRLR